jgi:hypothetical protein
VVNFPLHAAWLPCVFDQENNRRYNALEGKRCGGFKNEAARGFLADDGSKFRPLHDSFVTEFGS